MDARRREEGDDELPDVLEVQLDGEPDVTTYTRKDLGYLRLAYALSVHKSQGSEFGRVVLAIPTTRPSFMLRQLAYTGLTRAKTYCILISAQSAVQTYVQNEERVRRVTFFVFELVGIVRVEDPPVQWTWKPKATATEHFGDARAAALSGWTIGGWRHGGSLRRQQRRRTRHLLGHGAGQRH